MSTTGGYNPTNGSSSLKPIPKEFYTKEEIDIMFHEILEIILVSMGEPNNALNNKYFKVKFHF
jgi:hypothetical protein